MKTLRAIVSFENLALLSSILALAVALAAGCSMTPATVGRVESLESRVDQVASVTQEAARQTSGLPAIGPAIAAAATVAAGVSGLLHAIMGSLKRKDPPAPLAGSGTPP
jgi:hypothetical protein